MLTISQLERIGMIVATSFGVTLVQQGRSKRAGGLINSLKAKSESSDSVSILGNHYWRFVDKGVSASDIKSPFAPARINGLIKWLMRKGIGSGNKQIRSIAYAIASTHGKKGMPTMNGRRDKSRLNFIDKSWARDKAKIGKEVSTVFDESVQLILNKL